ncbi:polyhomeotic-like protein 3 isoform 1-T2 [Menidia menidia]
MQEMDRQSPENKQAIRSKTGATTSSTVTMATAGSSSSTCVQVPPASLSVIPPDRQAVQVIQHAIHRPQSMAAQYLHQMYAAQQQHFMLQTAALQQNQHPSHLQTLATIQQASVCQRQSPSSSSSSLVQPAGVSQNPITLPASPVTAQLIGQTQTSTAATTISQQAMLLGSRPGNRNQAQMYLRTQMLILTPAATVAAVQSDLPAVTSCSPLPSSSQVQNLALHAHLPGALAAAHRVILKPPSKPLTQPKAASSSKTAVCALKPKHLTDTSAETGSSDVTQLAPVNQQLSAPGNRRLAHHQLVLQQAAGAASGPKPLQPITLKVASPETSSSPRPLPDKHLSNPNTPPQPRRDPSDSSSPSPCVSNVMAPSSHASVLAADFQPQPPPLVAAPQRRTSFPQVQNQPPPPPPPLVLPRLSHHPPASVHRLSLHSVQALAVKSGQVQLTEQGPPVAEALVRTPPQNLPPPQTAAVDLKVHPVTVRESSPSRQICKVNGVSSEEKKDSSDPRGDATPTPLTGSLKKSGAGAMDSSSVTSSPSAISSLLVNEPAKPSTTTTTTTITTAITTTITTISSNLPPPPPPPLPPPVLPAAARSPSRPPSAPTSLPGSPDRSTQVLTHLVGGFVIREGLEPFPEVQTNGDAAEHSPADADQSDSEDSEMENDGEDRVCRAFVRTSETHGCSSAAAEPRGNAAGVLRCEYCGGRGPAHTFLRSKRFCSMTCVRRYSVSCMRRVNVQRAGRWARRPMGRRGRPPSRVNGASREHFLRQALEPFGPERTRQSSREEEEPPVPMTTRLRKQAERAREREAEQTTRETIIISDREDGSCPSEWNVERVFSYINTLPGGAAVAEQFRSQEIDGQALLLLTEDHLVSTMNLKLGPALKLCAHINSLKEA